MHSSKQFVNTLEDKIRFRGAMSKLISDYGQVEISNKVKDILRMYHSSSWHSEPCHQNQNPSEWHYRTIKAWTNTLINWQNAAESIIRELKKGAGRRMVKSNLWDDCLELEMEIRSCTTNNVFELKGAVPRTVMKGETPNITQSCEFGW